jgi:hypothetical protein
MNYDEHDHDHDMIIDNYRNVRCVSKEIRLRRRKHDLIIPYSIGQKKNDEENSSFLLYTPICNFTTHTYFKKVTLK